MTLRFLSFEKPSDALLFTPGSLDLSRIYFNSKFQPGRACEAGQLARKRKVQPRLLLCGAVDIENHSSLRSNASRRDPGPSRLNRASRAASIFESEPGFTSAF